MGDNLVAVAKINLQGEGFLGSFQGHEETVNVERRMRSENALGPGKNVFDESAGNDAE